MIQHLVHKEKKRIAVLFLVFSTLAVLVAITDRVPIHLEKKHPSLTLTQNNIVYLQGVVNGTLSGPYAYRVLIPFIESGIRRILPAFTIVDIDYCLKILFLIACQFSFYIYLRLFFSPFTSFAGVLFLDVLIAFSLSAIIGPSITETTDILNLTLYSLAFFAIYHNSFGLFILILFLGTCNRETTWLILPLFFLYEYITKKKLYRSVIAAFAVAIPYFVLRLTIQHDSPQWFTFEGLVRNIPFLSTEHTMKALAANVHVALLLVPLLILSFVRFNSQPLFLRAAMVITPFFIPIHYLFGTIIETRLWMPLFVVLIPLSLNTLTGYFSEDNTISRS